MESLYDINIYLLIAFRVLMLCAIAVWIIAAFIFILAAIAHLFEKGKVNSE